MPPDEIKAGVRFWKDAASPPEIELVFLALDGLYRCLFFELANNEVVSQLSRVAQYLAVKWYRQ